MMKTTGVTLMAGLMLCSQPLLAVDQHLSAGHLNSGGHTDVVVDMPPEVWTQGQNNQQPACQTCCTWQNRSYTEGAIVKMEGVLLQCARDEKSYGTNNLIWKIVR